MSIFFAVALRERTAESLESLINKAAYFISHEDSEKSLKNLFCYWNLSVVKLQQNISLVKGGKKPHRSEWKLSDKFIKSQMPNTDEFFPIANVSRSKRRILKHISPRNVFKRQRQAGMMKKFRSRRYPCLNMTLYCVCSVL